MYASSTGHIAASNPLVVRSAEIEASLIEHQKEIFKGQAIEEGKPANIAEKMVEGRLKKWLKDVCLLDQPFVKDTEKTVADLEKELTAKLGEKISVRRFARFEVGEGIEKRSDDFAAEVAKQAGL